MSRTLIATTDSEAMRLLERAGFAARKYHSPAMLAANADPGEVAVLSAPPFTPGVYDQLHARRIPIPVLAIGPDPAALIEAGADAAIARPIEGPALKTWVSALLRQRRRFEALMQRQKELEEFSPVDGLTGLFNRRWLTERLIEEFRRAQRNGEPLAFLMIDLDQFKAFNDTRGFAFGDRVLKAVSQLISRCVRDTDLSARHGSDEFAVLLPRTGLNGALTVAERIWQEAHEVSIDSEQVSLSLGVSVGPTAQLRGPALLLKAASEAVHRAKTEGRNRVCIVSPAR